LLVPLSLPATRRSSCGEPARHRRGSEHRSSESALPERDVLKLLESYAKNRDLPSRDALVRQYMPLAHRLARRYVRSSEPAEDLRQVASLGLLKALDRFDPARGPSFSSFAIPTILGELRRYFRDSTWAVHVPRSAQERAQAIEAAGQQLSAEGHAAPTVEQIAAHLQIAAEEVLEGMLAVRAYQADSLDSPCGTGEEEGRTLLEEVGEEDPSYEWLDAGLTVLPGLRTLDDRERRILRMRYVGEMSQSQIAAEIGVSQMQISRIIARSLERLADVAGLPSAGG
jgi:RNA polymerase sigma-B factor